MKAKPFDKLNKTAHGIDVKIGQKHVVKCKTNIQVKQWKSQQRCSQKRPDTAIKM